MTRVARLLLLAVLLQGATAGQVSAQVESLVAIWAPPLLARSARPASCA